MSGNAILFHDDIQPILRDALWKFATMAIEYGSSYLTCDFAVLEEHFWEEIGELKDDMSYKEMIDVVNMSLMMAYRLRKDVKE